MIDPLAEVIAHHAPRKPIDLHPTYPPPDSEPATYWEMAYAESLRLERRLRAERQWAVVVEFARTPGCIPQPVEPSPVEERVTVYIDVPQYFYVSVPPSTWKTAEVGTFELENCDAG